MSIACTQFMQQEWMRVCNWTTGWRGLSAYAQHSFITWYKHCLVGPCIDTTTVLHVHWPTCYLELLVRTKPSSYIMPILLLNSWSMRSGWWCIAGWEFGPSHSDSDFSTTYSFRWGCPAISSVCPDAILQILLDCTYNTWSLTLHSDYSLQANWSHKLEQKDGQPLCNSGRHLSTLWHGCWKR